MVLKSRTELNNDQESELHRLKSENARLKHENSRLRRDAAAYARDTAARHDSGTPEELISRRLQARQTMDTGSYFGYLFNSLRQSSPYRLWMRILTYFRRFRLISFILRFAGRVIAVIETSALLLLAATVLIIIIPPLLLVTLITLITAWTQSIRLNRRFAVELTGRKVYMFLPAAMSLLRDGSCLHATAAELADSDGRIVFVVTPGFFSPRGFGSRRFFFTSRKCADGIYLIRKYYFFMLRRRILSGLTAGVTYIY